MTPPENHGSKIFHYLLNYVFVYTCVCKREIVFLLSINLNDLLLYRYFNNITKPTFCNKVLFGKYFTVFFFNWFKILQNLSNGLLNTLSKFKTVKFYFLFVFKYKPVFITNKQ